MISTTERPNSVQASLIRLFDRPMQPEELSQVHNLLMAYYGQLIADEADRLVAEKGYTQADFDRVMNTSQRTQR
jgi:hypothetical protein